MGGWQEEDLARGCAQGDRHALEAASALLDSDQAYTRGRASEFLAGAPAALLTPLLLTQLGPAVQPIWWRVASLASPAVLDTPALRDAIAAHGGSMQRAPVDARYFLMATAARAQRRWASTLASCYAHDEDDGVAMLAMVHGVPPEAMDRGNLQRLEEVSDTRWLLRARWMRYAVDVSRPIPVDDLLAQGPWVYPWLSLIEKHRDGAWQPFLERQARPRWFGTSPVAERAAGILARWGDAALRERLVQWSAAGRQRRRHLAQLELLLAAPRLEQVAWVRDALGAEDADRHTLCVELARVSVAAPEAAVALALELRSPASQEAAVDVLAEHLERPEVIATLSRLAERSELSTDLAARIRALVEDAPEPGIPGAAWSSLTHIVT